MPITSIKRDWGVAPSGVRITSTDSLATVQTAGYMTAQAPVIATLNGGVFGFVPGDLVMVSASDGSEVFNFSGNDFSTLVPNAGGGGGGSVTSLQVQQSAFNYGIDTGVADAYIVDLSPAVTTLTDGLMVSFSAANYNLTSSPTLQINALTPVPILGINGGPVLAGDLNASLISYFIYSAPSAAFVLLNPFNSIAFTCSVQTNTYNTGIDSGVADAYVVTTTPGASPYMYLSNGMQISFTPLNNNITTTPTLTLNGLATVNIALSNGAVAAGDLSTNMIATVIYSSAAGKFILITPAIS